MANERDGERDEAIRADLTTRAGIEKAQRLLVGTLGWVLFPQAMAVKALVEWLGRSSEMSSEIAPEKQAEAAERIIAAGQRHGAKRIKITIDRDAGTKLKGDAKLHGEGVGIEASLGADGKMDLEIEYK